VLPQSMDGTNDGKYCGMEKTHCNYCHSGNTMMDVHNITIIYSFSVDGV